jgi:hypothetical protein
MTVAGVALIVRVKDFVTGGTARIVQQNCKGEYPRWVGVPDIVPS